MVEILELISAYGAPLVITGVVIYGIVKSLDIFLKYLEQKVLPQAMQKEKEADKGVHSENLVLRRIVDEQVKTSLNRLLLRTDAARLFVFEFHNGGENLKGLPFLRATNTYEVVNTGVGARISQHTAVPASIISMTASSLVTEGVATFNYLQQDEKVSEVAYDYMNKWKVTVTILARISSVEGELIGFVGIDFNSNHIPKDLEEVTEKIREVAAELGGLLSLNSKNSGGEDNE